MLDGILILGVLAVVIVALFWSDSLLMTWADETALQSVYPIRRKRSDSMARLFHNADDEMRRRLDECEASSSLGRGGR